VVVQVLNNFCRSCRKLLAAGPMSCILNFFLSKSLDVYCCRRFEMIIRIWKKTQTRHVFKYKHTKWSSWCITASLNYKNTMINIITMETVACLRSKCHLKQNLIPSWPCSFRHTNCISDFWCKTKYTNNKFCRSYIYLYTSRHFNLILFRRCLSL
jgi:hypothetical protein